jgi:hypothetical protein
MNLAKSDLVDRTYKNGVPVSPNEGRIERRGLFEPRPVQDPLQLVGAERAIDAEAQENSITHVWLR